jgi:hypothetical protein
VNTEHLRRLAENAAAFARCYTALVKALLAEGVPEDVAREEARATALIAAFSEDEEGRHEPWER